MQELNIATAQIETHRRLDTSKLVLSVGGAEIVLVFSDAEVLDSFADIVLDLLYELDDPFLREVNSNI